jgi:N utilization substance protein B
MGNRRFSRELVIQFLYLTEMNAGDIASQLEAFWESNPNKDEGVQTFTEDILNNIFEHKKEIDAQLEKYSDNWTLSRMTVIDRNLLRMAASELMYSKTVPPKVVIDEAEVWDGRLSQFYQRYFGSYFKRIEAGHSPQTSLNQ